MRLPRLGSCGASPFLERSFGWHSGGLSGLTLCYRCAELGPGPLALACLGHMTAFLCRTAGTLFGEGFRAFVTDWDKVTATVML